MGSYTLREAAQLFGITTKTLDSWMKKVAIEPTPDEFDKRRLLLSQSQIDELAGTFRRATRAPRPASASEKAADESMRLTAGAGSALEQLQVKYAQLVDQVEQLWSDLVELRNEQANERVKHARLDQRLAGAEVRIHHLERKVDRAFPGSASGLFEEMSGQAPWEAEAQRRASGEAAERVRVHEGQARERQENEPAGSPEEVKPKGRRSQGHR